MSELQTGLLLGLYAFLAGLYGLVYAAGRVLGSRAIGKATAIFAASHVLVLIVILLWMPLGIGWKLVLCAGSAVFISIPPLVWRLLQETHGESSTRC